jgi:Tol biopolymer transport system component
VTPERWRQVEELYHAARDLPVPSRSALLERADPELRAAVASLLAREDTAESNGAAFLERPAWEGHASLLKHVSPPIRESLKTETLIADGRQLGPYRIEQKIGEGGMGEVFRAVDTRLNRTVAVKVSFVKFNDRFQREARVIASLNHPHIAALFDIGTLPSGLGYLVLEYVEGLTLADLIKKGPLDPQNALRIALETAEAIEAAHDKGVVHRDLKPANIKLAENGAVKVLDFGLAKAMDEAQPLTDGEITRAGAILGTPCYMSPEQALGGPPDRRSDIWSFGVLVSEMLSGKRLFTGTSNSEILAGVVRGDPDLSDIPPGWEPLLRRCLTRDVRRRLQSIGEARLMLEDGLPAPVPLVGARRAFGLRSLWLWILVSAAAASVGAIGWMLRKAASPQAENPLANATFMRLTDYEGTEQDAAISPDGKFVAFLSARGGHRHVWLHEVGAGSTLDLTPGPQDENAPLRTLGFSGDGSEIWLAGTERRKIRLLPLVGGEPRVFLGEKAVNPVWSPDGARLAWQTTDAGDPIFVADRDGNNKRQIFRDREDKHNHYLTWSADSGWIYFVHGTPAVHEMDLWRIRASGGDPERLTHMNAELRDPTPLGKETILYLAQDNDGSGPGLWAFDIARKTSRRITFGLENYTSLSASADGRRLAVTVANPRIGLWSVPIVNSVAEEADIKAFPVPSGQASTPRFHEDALYYLSSQGSFDGLWRSQAGKAVEIWRGAEGGLQLPPAISPDGRQIVIVVRQEGKRRLRVITADGAESTALAPGIDVEGSADWSPDGKWIVAGGNDGKGDGLFKIPLAGGAAVRLTDKVGRNPVWSPKGDLIVYSGPNVFTLSPLMAVRPDGTPLPMPEIRTNRDGERVRFFPDGRQLVYMQGSEASPWQDFWLVDLATMHTRRLTRFQDVSAMRTFDITPGGKSIIFDRTHQNASVVLISLPSRN